MEMVEVGFTDCRLSRVRLTAVSHFWGLQWRTMKFWQRCVRRARRSAVALQMKFLLILTRAVFAL